MIAAYRPDCFSLPGTQKIPLSELADKPLLMIQRYEELVTGACDQIGLVPQIKCINLQIAVTLKLAQSGLGVAIVPLSSLSMSDNPLEYRILDVPAFATRRAVVTMRGRSHSVICRHFLDLCAEAFPPEAIYLTNE